MGFYTKIIYALRVLISKKKKAWIRGGIVHEIDTIKSIPIVKS